MAAIRTTITAIPMTTRTSRPRPSDMITTVSMPATLGLAKTCTKLGIAFWDYLGARLAVPGNYAVPDLTLGVSI